VLADELRDGHLPAQPEPLTCAQLVFAALPPSVKVCPRERTARFKRYPLLLVEWAGRMNRFQCRLRVRLCAGKEAIVRLLKVWEGFALPTQAAAFT